tara:strand:- start:14 stop:421 length:408 start_codon:yes stop_codon:yes gene_type:complete
MKKILFSLSVILFLNGCAESVALLGTGATNGRVVQSSLSSTISYGVKMQTGKTPLEHAIAFAEEKNPERKKETCLSIERSKSEFCAVIKKQISSSTTVLIDETTKIVQKLPKISKIKEISLIEKIAKKSVIYNRR